MTDPSLPDDERRSLDDERRWQARQVERSEVERQVAADAATADQVGTTDVEALRRAAARRRYAGPDDVAFETDVRPGRGLLVTSRVINVVFFVIYALLGLRLLLGLLGANPEARFSQWVTTVSNPLYAPFRGIFPNVTIEDGFTFALSVAFAILVYALLHALLHGIVRVFATPRGV